MLFDSWAHQFCLACDKQVQVDDEAYCSEACRLADFERTSSASSSRASSPGYQPSSWGTSQSTKHTSNKFYLTPAYDFSNAKPYGQSASHHAAPTYNLSPSSSHSSLCSINSTSSAGDANQLSEKARKELQAYAVSFEQVRVQRRRSY